VKKSFITSVPALRVVYVVGLELDRLPEGVVGRESADSGFKDETRDEKLKNQNYIELFFVKCGS
jgi:hypothetical protein